MDLRSNFRETELNFQLLPELALLQPIQRCCDRQQQLDMQPVSPFLDPRQEQQFLLDVRRQHQQVNDLRDPSAGDVAQSRQFRAVRDLARLDSFSNRIANTAKSWGARPRSTGTGAAAPGSTRFRSARPRWKWIFVRYVMPVVMLHLPL
jgi:hypothetical protein